MRFALTEDQTLLRDAVRSALSDACPPERVRAAWSEPDDELWSLLAELGILGLEVPEDLGGMGLGPVETCAVLVECGRVALPGPVIETLAAAPLLTDIGHDGLIDSLLAGDTQISAALEGHPHPEADRASLLLSVHGERLSDLIVQSLTPFPSIDRSRRLFTVDGNAHSLGDHGRALHDRCALGTAAFLLGVAEQTLDLAVDYAKQRRQFGKAIGTFQAVQHQLASALIPLRFATPSLYRAAWTLANRPDQASVEIAKAKVLASDAAHQICRTSLQIHGAIGYTFEYDLHLFHKRALALERAWGDATWHRDRIGDAMNLPTFGAIHA